MENNRLTILTTVLDYIEEHIDDELSQEDCARAAYCSLSNLQKLFRYVFHFSVGEYITKRRMSLAAKDIQSGISVLDTAIKYGYSSSEAFTRAFTRVWGETPSKFKKNRRFTGICPKLNMPVAVQYEGGIVMRRQFDVSDLYEFIRSKKGTYIVTFDSARLMAINENYGNEAGDCYIRETVRRVEEQLTDDMVMFRIGGDEFAVITCLSDKQQVIDFAESVLSQNGNTINYKGTEIPVLIRSGAMLIGDNCKHYSTLFTDLISVASLDPDVFNI